MTQRAHRGLMLGLEDTLVNTAPIKSEIYKKLFEAHGWPVDDQTLQLFTGRRPIDVFRTERGPWAHADPDALAAELDRLTPAHAVLEPVPGAANVVRSAVAANWAVAVVTSASRRWADHALATLGVSDLVSVVIAAQDVTEGKPDPQGYTLAAAHLRVAPNACLAVEDSIAGVQAARDARVPFVIAVSTTTGPRMLQFAGAATVLQDLRDFEMPPI